MHPIQHCKTILKHRHAVWKHCCRAGIPLQGLLHDLSKFSPAEFWVGALYWQGTRSPNEEEREQKGYSSAWMHHKGRNKHHFEYWTDYNPATKRMEPVPMPLRYVAEMFCDRVAASKVYLGDAYTDAAPLEYYLRGKQRRVIHPRTANALEHLLTMLAEQGEEKTFAHLRRALRRHDS
ncbi:MAG: catalase [Ruminococcus sp.]|nr:catalase [Ruminococcus sp.]